MKELIKIIALTITVLILPTISAEILLQAQPEGTYNFGDHISLPTKVTTTTNLSGFLQMFLICSGQQSEFYKEYIVLLPGQEKQVTPSLLLVKSLIGTSKGNCVVKATLLGEYVLTNEFEVSNLLEVEITSKETNFNPGQSAIIEGQVTKLNGQGVNGIVELTVSESNATTSNTITNGYFSLNLSLRNDEPAGAKTLRMKVYERDSEGNETNIGFVEYTINVNQIAQNLEILFENEEVLPGNPVKIKTILHDQTGVNIPATSIVTIKNSKGKIKEQREISTDEFFEYNVLSNEPATQWTVYTVSNKLASEGNFTILENQAIDFQLVNKTLILTNIGNIVYNKTVLIKIGEESLNIETNIPVDKSQKFLLSAPDGEYEIQVITDGESRLTENTVLTGKAVDIKQISAVSNLVRRSFVWIFVIAVLGFMAFMILRKGTKRTFIGKINFKRKNKFPADLKKNKSFHTTTVSDEEINLSHIDNTLVSKDHRAELSLSLKGNKQDASIICMKIKNIKDLKKEKHSALEALRLVIGTAEKEKAVIYENFGFIFFIISPTITKTFKNELPAVKLAKKIKEALSSHNKMFQNKIDFGISVNRGTIVAQKQHDGFSFMSLGNLISSSKKVATLANREVLLTQKLNEKILSEVKTEKHTRDSVPVYIVKGIRDREENKHFLRDFIKRMEEGNKK